MMGITVSGCSTRQSFNKINIPDAEINAYLSDKPDALKPAYKRLIVEGRRNAVLNQMRLGLDAYQLGYKKLAAEAFDKALLGIETVYANNETAQKARSLWYEEGMKDFKGEPYERAMAYYYRGLLFLEDEDYENARAAFKSGVMQDAFAEEKQFRCDFAILIFLEGWASQMAGDINMADMAYKEVKKLRPDFEMETNSNVIIIIETGKSPRKVADGPGHAELKFRRGRNFMEDRVEISINGGNFFELYLMEDIFWQASTRGGRQIDKILKGQVIFKQTQERVGTTVTDISSPAMVVSPFFKNTKGIQSASAALGIFGVAEMALAARVRPHADTRYWDNLPDKIHVHLAYLPEGEHQIKVHFKDKNGRIIQEFTKVLNFKVEQNKPTLLWIRSRQQLSSTKKY
jgi:tetratricopeptide (TPR) repeat protein